MEIPLIREIVVIFGLSIGVLLVCHRLHIPNVVGFILTGLISGPHGLGLIGAISDVQMLANIGIVLLLFTVGMGLSFNKILEYKNYFFKGGMLQVALTTLAGFLVAKLLGRPSGEAVFLGFLLSLSSTAIVLRILEESNQSKTPHGKLMLGILIFQDIVAIPMMLSIPVLAGYGEDMQLESLLPIFKGFLILVVVGFCAVKIVPMLLYYVVRTRNKELFLLSIFTVCFSVAWITSSMGLSLSLGAFLAGLVISESDYSNEAIGDILPFQDLFTSFFFVSIGMLLDLDFVFGQPFFILAVAIGIMLMKTTLIGLVALILEMPLRTVVIGALGLSQVGEFSFVLAKSGFEVGLGSDYRYQLFLAVSLLTMAAAPSLLAISPYISDMLSKLPLPNKLKTGLRQTHDESHNEWKDHIIIVGFGPSGQHLAMSARVANIPYNILEMNPDTVKREKLKGEPIHFGDATHPSVLQHVHIKNALVIAVVINDPIATLRVVKLARQMNSDVYIIVRTRYLQEVPLIYNLGANDVIPDEFGSSVEIFTRVLQKYGVPSANVEKFVQELRISGYETLYRRTP